MDSSCRSSRGACSDSLARMPLKASRRPRLYTFGPGSQDCSRLHRGPKPHFCPTVSSEILSRIIRCSFCPLSVAPCHPGLKATTAEGYPGGLVHLWRSELVQNSNFSLFISSTSFAERQFKSVAATPPYFLFHTESTAPTGHVLPLPPAASHPHRPLRHTLLATTSSGGTLTASASLPGLLVLNCALAPGVGKTR